MQRGLATLLEGVIDYAGLFPPAKLSMEAAVEEYIALRQGDNNWLVSRFAVPAAHLSELGAELEKHELDEVFPLAVIGTGSPDHHHWKAALDHDLAALKKFVTAFSDRAYVEAFEVKIPNNNMIDEAIRLIGAVQVEDLFIELPWADGIEESIAALAGCETVFAKARTGGTDASSFPDSEDLALFLQHCVQLDLPFKLTAGLHHPLPHKDPATGARMHGFLNVLAAVALSYQEDLSVGEITKVLNEDKPRAFEFSDEDLSWNGITVPAETLEESRELFLSFGSCSVDEPAAGLISAGFGAVPAV